MARLLGPSAREGENRAGDGNGNAMCSVVTLGTEGRRPILGVIVDAQGVSLSAAGECARDVWKQLPDRFPEIEVGELEILPNEVRGIVRVRDGCSPRAPLVTIVGTYRRQSAKAIRRALGPPGLPIWNSGYGWKVLPSRRRAERALASVR